mgnify:CR=1 FL=1
MSMFFGRVELSKHEQMTSKAIISSAKHIEMLLYTVADGHERDNALNRLEECVMWANKAIAKGHMREETL